MPRKINRALFDDAKANKNDEFYTQLCDIESELQHYKAHFKGKVVYCNCDDPFNSNFFVYFVQNFKTLGIKKLICSCYKKTDLFNFSNGYYYEYTGENPSKISMEDIIKFKGNGDFRSAESIELLKKADIVVTNPPFSLFREYVAQIIAHKKKFLIIGNVNSITYKEIFSLIQNNLCWLGVNLGRGISGFIVPQYYELYGTETKIDENGNRIIATNNCLWLTNMDNSIRNNFIHLIKKYHGNENEYPKYDNYDGINVDQTKNIPADYEGAMGVPITFLHKFNPNQFEIIQFRKGNDGKDLSIQGKCPFFRIIVKNKHVLK